MLHKIRPGLYERVPGPPYDARAAYVARWREANWPRVYADPWICPLCNEAVQTPATGYPEEAAETHRRSHGDDWAAYVAAGEE